VTDVKEPTDSTVPSPTHKHAAEMKNTEKEVIEGHKQIPADMTPSTHKDTPITAGKISDNTKEKTITPETIPETGMKLLHVGTSTITDSEQHDVAPSTHGELKTREKESDVTQTKVNPTIQGIAMAQLDADKTAISDTIPINIERKHGPVSYRQALMQRSHSEGHKGVAQRAEVISDTSAGAHMDRSHSLPINILQIKELKLKAKFDELTKIEGKKIKCLKDFSIFSSVIHLIYCPPPFGK
jgi:hypothetical protein